ncbi:MAG: YdcF family protein [Crocinitomicaceae bacterium]
MFFVLSKLLSFFLQPIMWVVLIIVPVFLFRKHHLKKKAVKLSIIVSLFFSNTVIFLEFVRLWEIEGVRIENIEHHDIGIVLGGMAEYNNDLDRLSLRRGGDRIWQAIQLYKTGKIERILISGANGHLIDKGLNEALQLKQDLVRMGIPKGDIITESVSKNTHQNAVMTKEIIDQMPKKQSVLLITSAIHMKRAQACFKKAGFSGFDVFSTDHFTGRTRGYVLDQYIIPDIFTFAIWNQLIKEWIGYLVYDMIGYI